MEFSIVNIVVIARTAGKLNLREVHKKLGTGGYQPKSFSALTAKFSNPKATAIIFSTGNITVMGSKDVFSALTVIRHLKNKLGLTCDEICISNIVIKSDFGKKINLDKFYHSNSEKTNYDSALFPSCSHTFDDSGATANIFASGRLMIPGIKSLDKVKDILALLYKRISDSQ